MENTPEILMAIKIGQLKLGDIFETHKLPLIEALNALGVKWEKDAVNHSYCNQHLKTLFPHYGDASLLRYVLSIDVNSKQDLRELSAFMLGICYMYPVRSFVDEILPLINKKLNWDMDIFTFHVQAREMYDTFK